MIRKKWRPRGSKHKDNRIESNRTAADLRYFAPGTRASKLNIPFLRSWEYKKCAAGLRPDLINFKATQKNRFARQRLNAAEG